MLCALAVGLKEWWGYGTLDFDHMAIGTLSLASVRCVCRWRRSRRFETNGCLVLRLLRDIMLDT